MTNLTDDIKLFIVQQLACHNSPSQVADDVYEEFGIKLERGKVQKYDPTKVAGKQLSKKYREIFEAMRTAFLNETTQIPIASKTFRLRSLQRMHDKLVEKKNFVQAAAILEQAAKEVSGFYGYRNQLVPTNDGDSLIEWLKTIGNSSLPIVYDVSNINEHEQKSQTNGFKDSVEVVPLESKIKWQLP